MLEKNCLENISQGKAFLKTKEGLLGVNPHDCVALDKILNDINALLATKIWALSDGTTPAEKIETEETVETKEENTETEEVVEEKIEETVEVVEEKIEETVEEKPKKKTMAPKCAKKINKPALD